ncbi:YncE family protein, partial [Bacillus toyonensis]
IDGRTDKVVDMIQVGHIPVAVGVNLSNNHIYVVNNSSRNVYVISGHTHKVIVITPVGDLPEGVGVNSIT